jgi:hypothetical protein
MSKKLGSKMIASWIASTTFFKSLINMIPGFNYLIYLGQILQDLENDPSLIYVLDSPSSGHALTMMEAISNFKKIFNSGIIFNDTIRMSKMIEAPNFARFNIITLPSLLAANEAIELKSQLTNIINIESRIFLNASIDKSLEQDISELKNDYVKERVAIEREVFKTLPELTDIIPFVISINTCESAKKIVHFMNNLV